MREFVEVDGRKVKLYKRKGRTGLRLNNKYIRDISEIKGLDSMTHLNHLILDNNEISEIKGLETFVELKILSINNNQITEIKG
ncbi:hypothetical protein LCGC14_1910560, partial [marine sediment metagenome]